MKKSLIAGLFCIGSAFLFSCGDNNQTVKEGEFYVRGNCGMCEERIESTLKEIPGVMKADYDVKTKNIFVAYDSTKVTELALHTAVAKTGHETKEVAMDEAAHEELPECCKKYNHGHEEDTHEHEEEDHTGHNH